ncbi:MAG: helix-turn-helix domain-containing protein [Halanaeroarchaeum sp.]
MSDTDEPESEESDEGVEIPVETREEREGVEESAATARERIEEEADRARSEFDRRVVDILSWVLDTETRARIFVYLRRSPWSTSEEVAEGTGLYPSTVRESLAELTEEGIVERRKRESEGAGNNPYEYTAIPPSDLVGNVVGRVQDELNTLFNLDSHLAGEEEPEDEPVTIEVTSGGNTKGTDRDVDEGADEDVDETASEADDEDGEE